MPDRRSALQQRLEAVYFFGRQAGDQTLFRRAQRGGGDDDEAAAVDDLDAGRCASAVLQDAIDIADLAAVSGLDQRVLLDERRIGGDGSSGNRQRQSRRESKRKLHDWIPL